MNSKLETAQSRDLRTIALSWENYRIALEEFHVAIKFYEWDRAEACRQKVLGSIEANLDAHMSTNRRNELAQFD